MKISDQKFLKCHGIDIDFSILYSDDSDSTPMLKLLREKIFEIIKSIEQSAKNFSNLSEDGITDIIATSLNSTLYFTAIREENSRGHVDITVKAPTFVPDHVFTYLGEAKIWNGVKYSLRGFDQLNEYSSGRYLDQFTLTYFKKLNCDSLFTKFKNELVTKKSCDILPNSTNRYFQTQHRHMTGSLLKTDHYSVNMYIG